MEFLVPRSRLGWLLFRLWLLGFFLGRVLFLDSLDQGFLPGIGHRAVALIWNSVRRPKGNAPLEEQLQLHLHGVRPGLHHDKLALGHTFELVRGHEGALHHLQGLGPVVFPLADVTRLHSPAAQGFAHRLGSFAVGGEAAEDGELHIVHDDLRPLFAITPLQLAQALDDGDDGEPPGTAGGEHHFRRLDLWQSPILVSVEHRPVGQLPAVLIRHGEDLPVQLLDNQRHHEEFAGIFLGHYQEQGGGFLAECLRVHRRIKAQQLLHLRIQEPVQPGEGRGHDRSHGLFSGGDSRPGKPPGLMCGREESHQVLKLVAALFSGDRSHELLDDLEHRYDVPLRWRAELRHQQDGSGEQALGGVVEELVLPEVLAVHPRRDDGLRDDFGVSFRLGLEQECVRVLPVGVHVLVHQVQQVESIAAGGVAQVNDPYPVAVALLGDPAVIPHHVALGVRGEERHPAGQGILQAGVQPVGGFAHTGGTDHDGVDVPGVHQGSGFIGGLGNGMGFPQQLHHQRIPHCPQSISQAVAFCQASYHDALFSGQVLPFSPQLWLEPHMGIRLFDFPLGGPPGGAMLPVAHGLCSNVETVHSGQSGNQAQGSEHGCSCDHQLHDWLQKINSLLVLSDSPSRKEKRPRIFHPVENPKPDFFPSACFLAYR